MQYMYEVDFSYWCNIFAIEWNGEILPCQRPLTKGEMFKQYSIFLQFKFESLLSVCNIWIIPRDSYDWLNHVPRIYCNVEIITSLTVCKT